MKKLFIVAILLSVSSFSWAEKYGEFSLGLALPSENIELSELWEIRYGKKDFKIGKYFPYGHDLSLGFSNYSSDDSQSAPDRLLPGGLALRSFNLEYLFLIKVHKKIEKLTVKSGAGLGWTWVSHSAGDFSLDDFETYERHAKVVEAQENVRDNFSFTYKVGFDYSLTKDMTFAFTARYFMLHTMRHREVLLYHNEPSKIYNDRYHLFSSNSPIDFDFWSLTASIKFFF